MKCLVLGGNGFIGSHLVDRLLAEKHEVRVFDKYKELYRPSLSSVDYRFGDFGNRGLLSTALIDIDIVFHLINTTLPKTSNDDPAFDISSNVVETIYLLEKCVSKKIKKIIYISSGGTVYGVPETLPIKEDSPTNPLCSYGIAKLANEKYLFLFNHLYGLDYTVIRPSNPYGSRQNPLAAQGAISVFLARTIGGETINIWGDGEIVRDYLFIDDLVDGIYKAAVTETRSRIFNVGSGVGISLNAIVKAIRTIANLEVKVEYTDKRLLDVPKILLDITRAKDELGWMPATSLESGLKMTYGFVSGLLKEKEALNG
jgi:UDP-glucose 4-epimerase